MIARLRGRIVGRAGSGLIVDVSGVGYLVHATPSVQRLGYLLDAVGAGAMTNRLAAYVAGQAAIATPNSDR